MCVCLFTRVDLHVCMGVNTVYVCARLCMFVRMRTRACMCVHADVSMCVCACETNTLRYKWV